MEQIIVKEMPDMKDGEIMCNKDTAFALMNNMKHLETVTVTGKNHG